MTFTTFTCTFNNFLQFGNLKVCIFSTLKKYIFEKKITFLWKKLYKTDTFLYVLTVEKAAVSLPTKFLGNPTSGSASGGDYTIFRLHHLPGREHQPVVVIILRCSNRHITLVPCRIT